MTADNTSNSLSQLPLLSGETKRILRLGAWRDEIFRDALIADPKGVIQHLFPHCFPNGKLPDDLTIKVIEEDPSTHHIVLPVLADEESILEIPEEQQVDLIANMGDGGKFKETPEAKNLVQSTGKRNFDPYKHLSKIQEYASEPEPRSKREKLSKAVRDEALRDPKFSKKLDTNSNEAIKGAFPEYNVSDDQKFQVHQDTQNIHHIVIPKPLEASQSPGVLEENQLDLMANIGSENGCKTKSVQTYPVPA